MPENSSFFIKDNISRKTYSLDSEANAIIIYESQSITITREYHGSTRYYSQRYHVKKIVKFLNTTEVSLANVHVYNHNNDLYNYVENVEGKTYNLEGKDIKETPILKSDVFRKQVKEDLYETTFSLPAVKDGCIIEYAYDVVSNVKDILPEWSIQGRYPKLVTDYEVSYPQDFEYTSVAHVRPAKHIYPNVASALFGVDDFCQVNTPPNTREMPVKCFWMRKNVPAIKNEPFVYNSENNVENMSMQLTGIWTSTV